MSIPVLGVAAKSPENVAALIDSVDHPVGSFFVADISGSNQNFSLPKNPHIDNLFVSSFPGPVGAAVAWNVIIKCFMKSPYWVIAADNLRFGSGLLSEMDELMENPQSPGLVHARSGDFGVGSWDLFIIASQVVEVMGLFDENFKSRDFAGADYFFRTVHRPIRKVFSLNSSCVGFNADEPEPPSSIDYLEAKWGGWRTCNPFFNPFDNGEFPVFYFPK